VASHAQPWTASGGEGHALGVPLVFQDRLVGALLVSRPAPFGDRDVALAEVVGAQLALAIERHRTGEVMERRLAEVTLRQVQLEAEAVGAEVERVRADKLAGQLRDLNESYLATVRGLAIAIETKDENTPGHLQRVTRYGLSMLRILAPDAEQNKQYEYGFLMHDIGMLAVPDAILRKPGELSEQEWELLRGHPAVGYRMLDGIPYLAQAKEIVLAHHERWDGRGYPLGLEGPDIPLGARVFPLADAFEAMTSDRPYRPAMSVDDALAELRLGAGRQFWPNAVEAFCSIPSGELDKIQRLTGSITSDTDIDDD
jgi:ribonuclease P protein subunit RPR2